MIIRFPIVMEPQNPSGYLVRFLDMEDTFTQGETENEALANASEVLTAMLGWRMDNDIPIPEPSVAPPGGLYAVPDAKTQAALLVRRAKDDLPMSAIARGMVTSDHLANRLANPHRWPSLKQLEKAATIFGKKLVISFE